MSEWIKRSTPDPILLAQTPVFDGSGFSFQGGYLFPSNYEMALRYAGLYPEESIKPFLPANHDYTLGFSKYFYHYAFKVQGDISYLQTRGVSSNNRVQIRMQMTLNF